MRDINQETSPQNELFKFLYYMTYYIIGYFGKYLLIPLTLGLLFLIIIFSFLNQTTNFIMQQYAIHKAFLNGYNYINYVEFNSPSYLTGFVVLFVVIYIAYILFCIFLYVEDNQPKTRLFISSLSIIPILFFCFNHKNTDEFMYQPIHNLYNKVNVDDKFKNTSVGKQFKKAIEEKDYEQLRILSNNFKSLATLTPEQLSTASKIIENLPIKKIKEKFNHINNGFLSYMAYDTFYIESLEFFNSSKYKNRKELKLLMKQLNIINHDYNQLKTDI